MKKTLLLLLSTFFVSSALVAQSSETKTYVVQFVNKGVNTDAAINPSLYLTDKAIERRLKQHIAFDQTDIPVNEEYVSFVAKAGARVLTRSRWFNNIVIQASPDIIAKISGNQAISEISLLDNVF